MYYTLNEDNKIAAASDYKFDENAIYTEEEIVRDYDGQLVFKHETETDEYLKIKVEKDREKALDELRYRRVKLLEAFDKWEKAVLRGRAEDDETVMAWYRDLLDLKAEAFESVPEAVRYYL